MTSPLRHHTAIDWMVDLGEALGRPARVWNPVRGCRPVSRECAWCWAARLGDTRSGHPNPTIRSRHEGLATRNAAGRPVFKGIWRTIPADLDIPSRIRRSAVIFLGSETDLFGEGVPEAALEVVWRQVEDNSHHVYLVLTKRAARMAAFLRDRRPLPNLLAGISAGDQGAWDERGPYLGDLAALGWQTLVSAEPLIGPLRLGLAEMPAERLPVWVIVGGLSGAPEDDGQPMHPLWPQDLRDECRGTGIAFYFKQWGDYAPWRDFRSPAVSVSARGIWWPMGAKAPAEARNVAVMSRLGKARAGHGLDGRDIRELPALPDLAATTRSRVTEGNAAGGGIPRLLVGAGEAREPFSGKEWRDGRRRHVRM
jgi:protein gp37